jgi:hypothetical protein
VLTLRLASKIPNESTQGQTKGFHEGAKVRPGRTLYAEVSGYHHGGNNTSCGKAIAHPGQREISEFTPNPRDQPCVGADDCHSARHNGNYERMTKVRGRRPAREPASSASD